MEGRKSKRPKEKWRTGKWYERWESKEEQLEHTNTQYPDNIRTPPPKLNQRHPF